jgi:hypothetical protein
LPLTLRKRYIYFRHFSQFEAPTTWLASQMQAAKNEKWVQVMLGNYEKKVKTN